MEFATNYQYENGFTEQNMLQPSPIPGDPRIYNAPKYFPPPQPLICTELDKKSDDELFIETWLSQNGKINLNLDSTIVTHVKRTRLKQKPAMPIHAVKEALRKCLLIVDKLEATQLVLKSNVSQMCSDDWKKRTIEIGALKDELSTLMAQFHNPNVRNVLKYAIKERQRKRETQRRRKVEKRRRLAEELKERADQHKEIDVWLDNMKEQVAKAKAEETMKKDADCVLAEVTRKKSEARKHISLVAALTKLRRIRQQNALHRGAKLSAEDNAAFNKTSENLMRIWEGRMNSYQKEEHALKVMLDKNATDDMKTTNVMREKRIVQLWEHILFGEHYVPSPIYWGLTSADRDLETFIAIRKSWDTFQSNGEGSSIPIGWILPSATSNKCWNQYLQQ